MEHLEVESLRNIDVAGAREPRGSVEALRSELLDSADSFVEADARLLRPTRPNAESRGGWLGADREAEWSRAMGDSMAGDSLPSPDSFADLTPFATGVEIPKLRMNFGCKGPCSSSGQLIHWGSCLSRAELDRFNDKIVQSSTKKQKFKNKRMAKKLLRLYREQQAAANKQCSDINPACGCQRRSAWAVAYPGSEPVRRRFWGGEVCPYVLKAGLDGSCRRAL